MTRLKQELDSLAAEIAAHSGMAALRDFGIALRARPLDRAGLAILFASTGEFFKEIPSGILALGLRLCDEYRATDRFGAVRKAAEVLYSAVDEFGLHDLSGGIQDSHHQLFRISAEAWGLAEAELTDPANILPEACAMADLTYRGYREGSIAASLGFHLASELTSDVEFNLCYEGLLAFPEAYRLDGRKDSKLEFYRIHTLVEPMHGATSRRAIADYLAKDDRAWSEIREGAIAFMVGYGRLFVALGQAISHQSKAVADAA